MIHGIVLGVIQNIALTSAKQHNNYLHSIFLQMIQHQKWPHCHIQTWPGDITSNTTSQQATEHDDICQATLEQAEFWKDAMNEEDLDEMRGFPIPHSMTWMKPWFVMSNR